MSQASCAALSAFFTAESGRIVPEIQSKMDGRNILIDHIPRAPFPDGMGYILNTLTVERNFSTQSDDTAWTNVTPSTGSGNDACLPAVDQLTFGQTLLQWQLQRAAVESPDLCLEDLRTEFDIEQQLAKSTKALTDAIQWKLECNFFNTYMAACQNRINVNALLSTATGSNLWDLTNPPTSSLTQGVLDTAYMSLLRESSGDGSMGRSGAAYIYPLICEPEVSRALIQQNADIRQDWRYAQMGDNMQSDLLKPYGVDRSYGNFAHWTYEKMPRYDLVANQWVRRSYWSQSSATKGFKSVVSPLYLAAAYTTSIIFNPKVMTFRVPGTLDRPGGKTSFSTPDYFPATMDWKNIPHRTCNPDGTIGFFRAVLAGAPEPIHPEYGYIFLHLRCAPPLSLQACD